MFTQSVTKILFTPPDIPLPITAAPCLPVMRQLHITTFSQGLPTLQPSSFIPELMAIQSSPVQKSQSSIQTFWQESGFNPSVLCPEVLTVTPFILTSSQYTGCMVHCGPSSMVIPSTLTCLQLTN